MKQLHSIPEGEEMIGSFARKFINEGKIEGEIKGKTKVAAAMLAKGMDIALISELTKLTVEEINNLNSCLDAATV